MKKLSIIAGLVLTTVFFASCEHQNIGPAKSTIDLQPSITTSKDIETKAGDLESNDSLPKPNKFHTTIDIEKSLLTAHN